MQRWIDKKLIPSFRTPGGHRRVLGRDLLQFIALRGMEPHAAAARADIIGVDDEAFSLAILRSLVAHSRPDLSWLGVASGFEAGVQIMRHQPSLVLLDIAMPGVDGRDVCRMIRLSPELEKTKIIVTTGHRDPAILQSARDAGADDVLTKPINPALLEAHLKLVPAALGRLVNA